MTEVAATAEHIDRAVEAVARQRPAYRHLMEYYGRVFTAQAEMRPQITAAAPAIRRAEAVRRLQNGFGALSLTEFPVDTACAALLVTLCAILGETRPEHAEAAAALAGAIERGDQDAHALLRAVIEEADGPVTAAAEAVGLPPDLLGALLYQSLQPSLSHTGAQMAALLGESALPHPGQCPICGSDPAFSLIDDAGKRSLFCGFCWHRWPVLRMACPHCGNAEADKHAYFFDPSEKEYRVDVCNACKWYVKTVDAREMNRPLHPPLEQLATMHLDMLAQEKGYTKGV